MVKNMMEQNKMERGEIVWRDGKVIELISWTIIILSTLLFIYLAEGYIEKLEATLVILVGVFTTYFQLIRKMTIVSSLGVFVGNVTAKKWKSLKLGPGQFISWEIISSIKLVNHEVKGPRGSWPRAFVEVRTNDKKFYECVIHNTQGFIQALKKLNKYFLLSKDSRYK